MTNAAHSVGVAVIEGGMTGHAHAAGFRTAFTLFSTDRPDVRLAAIADVNRAVAGDTARRYGYHKAVGSWQEVAADPEVDAVSVVVANQLHHGIVDGLLEAGKHVLCEKPLVGSLTRVDPKMAINIEHEDTEFG
jgi:predicted dehydrogenase